MDFVFKLCDGVLRFFIYRVFKLKWDEDVYGKLFQFIKYALVGLTNTAVSYFVYLLCTKVFSIDYRISNFIGFSVSVVNAYYWSNKYVFEAKDGVKRVWWITFIKTYISYAVFGLFVHTALLTLFVEKCGISDVLAPIILIFIITPMNFVANKFWAYKDKKKNVEENGKNSD